MREDNPKVFISYSWEDEPHNEWVLRLATDLRMKGVDVTLDRWHLRIADDIAAFMDESVTKAEYILLVCTPTYAEKSNARRGGVGYEQTIISGELLTETSTGTKFIPLLRAGTPSTSLPRYLKTKLFVDFRDENKYEHSLTQLLRHLFNASEHVPPVIGARPPFEDTGAEAPPLHAQQHESPPPTLASESYSMSVPEGWTFQMVVDVIARNDGAAVDYEGFTQEELNAPLREWELQAGGPAEAISKLRLLTSGVHAIRKYEVRREGAAYYLRVPE